MIHKRWRFVQSVPTCYKGENIYIAILDTVLRVKVTFKAGAFINIRRDTVPKLRVTFRCAVTIHLFLKYSYELPPGALL